MQRLGVVRSANGMYVRRDETVIEGETVPDPPPRDDQPESPRPGPIVIAGEIEEGPADHPKRT